MAHHVVNSLREKNRTNLKKYVQTNHKELYKELDDIETKRMATKRTMSDKLATSS